MSKDKVRKWVRKLKEEGVDIHDEQRSGRPTIFTNKVLAKVENFVREDQRLILDELRELISELSWSLIHEAITKKLGFHKL